MTTVCALLVALGVLSMVFVVYLDLFGGQGAMLCAKTTDPVCSGQYVYGFPNEVWPGLAILAGATGLVFSRARKPQLPPA
jgi:hypothetical protein